LDRWIAVECFVDAAIILNWIFISDVNYIGTDEKPTKSKAIVNSNIVFEKEVLAA